MSVKQVFFLASILLASSAYGANQYLGRPVGGGQAAYSAPTEDDVGTSCTSGQVWKSDGAGGMGCAADLSGGGGTPNVLDLGDDGSDESVDLVEIVTTGDTNSVFTEPSADKLLINVGQNWPTADESDNLSSNITAIGGRTPW